MRDRLDPHRDVWMRTAPVRAVVGALEKAGGEVRFVGGAVRNALLDEPVGDIDIATTLNPDAVTSALEAAGLTAVATGVEHGTVTAVASGVGFEITTLRRDVSTDGRRAVVAFTKDWKEDALRRDFTINALYADADGKIYDTVGGLADLAERRVRFVGDAKRRIEEDYLRILRLFRFHAWYGKGEIDMDALAAASSAKSGIAKLSGERVQKELLRLLQAKDPLPVLRVMDASGILAEVLPDHASLDVLERLLALERTHAISPDAILRLAALMGEADKASRLAERLRFSNADRARLTGALALTPVPSSEKETRASIYRNGARTVEDALLLNAARRAIAPGDPDLSRALAQTRSWKPPKFPLDGKDAQNSGFTPSPQLGAALAQLEREWIASDFTLSRENLLAALKTMAKG